MPGQREKEQERPREENGPAGAEAESEAVRSAQLGRASPEPATPHTCEPRLSPEANGKPSEGVKEGLIWQELYFQKILFGFKKKCGKKVDAH